MSEQTSVEVAAQTPEQTPESRMAELEARVAALTGQLEAIAAKKAPRKGGSTGPRAGTLYAGLTQSALRSALGYAMWTPAQVQTLLVREYNVLTANSSNVGWGRQWRKGVDSGEVVAGQTKYKSYGPRPVVLTPEQLAELAGMRDGVKVEEVAITDEMREVLGLVA